MKINLQQTEYNISVIQSKTQAMCDLEWIPSTKTQ